MADCTRARLSCPARPGRTQLLAARRATLRQPDVRGAAPVPGRPTPARQQLFVDAPAGRRSRIRSATSSECMGACQDEREKGAIARAADGGVSFHYLPVSRTDPASPASRKIDSRVVVNARLQKLQDQPNVACGYEKLRHA